MTSVWLPLLALLLAPMPSGVVPPESYYRDLWCTVLQGEAEVVLADKTRVDCLTREYAVEVDFAPKWAEAIGQALHYARMTARKPAVLLVLRKKKDIKYLVRLMGIADEHGIHVFACKDGL